MNIILATVLTEPKTEYVEKIKDTATNVLAVENWKDRNGKEYSQLYALTWFGKRGTGLAPYLTVGSEYQFSGRARGGSYVAKTGPNAGAVQQVIKMNNCDVEFPKGVKKPAKETLVEAAEVPIDPEDGPF